MSQRSTILLIAVGLMLMTVSPGLAQTDEVKLDSPQSRITTVSAMRVRKAKELNEALTDDVIKRSGGAGRDKYAVEERAMLRKTFVSLRSALTKTSGPDKDELVKKLARVGR